MSAEEVRRRLKNWAGEQQQMRLDSQNQHEQEKKRRDANHRAQDRMFKLLWPGVERLCKQVAHAMGGKCYVSPLRSQDKELGSPTPSVTIVVGTAYLTVGACRLSGPDCYIGISSHRYTDALLSKCQGAGQYGERAAGYCILTSSSMGYDSHHNSQTTTQDLAVYKMVCSDFSLDVLSAVLEEFLMDGVSPGGTAHGFKVS